MGNCFVQVDSHDVRDIEVFNSIFLSKTDVASLFNVFNEVDVDGGGSISLSEFMVTQHLENSPILDLILKSFNMLNWNFLEFSCLMWNFLSIDESYLSAFMFFIFNKRKKPLVPFREISKYYHSVHGGNFKGNVKLIAPLSAIEQKCGDTGVSSSDFINFCKTYPIICAPLVTMQFNLRDKIIGLKFWQTLTLKRCRQDAPHLMDPMYVYEQVAARRQELNVITAELEKRGGGGKDSFARRMSVAIRGQQKGKGGGKGPRSVRKKQTRIGHAARRLSVAILPGTRVDLKNDSSKNSKKGGVHSNTKGKKGKENKYGFDEGNPDDNEDDNGKDDNDTTFDNGNTNTNSDGNAGAANKDYSEDAGAVDGNTDSTLEQHISKKKTTKGKSKQIHPEDANLGMGGDEDNLGVTKEDTDSSGKNSRKPPSQKSKKSSKLSGAVRRMSTSLTASITSVTKKSSKKKNKRVQRYAAAD